MNAVTHPHPVAATVIRPRARPRNVSLDPTPEQVASALPENVLSEIQKTIRLQNEANKASSALRKQQADLTKLLIANELDGQIFAVLFGEDTYDAGVYSEDKDVIDVSELRKQTADDVFMACVKATKGDVEKNAGKVVLAKVTKTEKADASLHVKKRRT